MSFNILTFADRPLIRQLNQTLINQIAAGEVIERPASALKELVENSIDAKANYIHIILRDGGKSFIQVTDNGVGMTAQDLEMSLQRHATSKLPEDDLFFITTLGFRGEALPSIGSVSRLTITSFPKNSEQNKAMEIFVDGGSFAAVRPSAYPKHGTQITIKDLFYATPARLKFLKTDANEAAACIDVIKRLALSVPHVAFCCQIDDKIILDYKVSDTLSQRCRDVLSQKTCENLQFFEAEKDGIHIHGMVSLPTFHKSQATEQFFFVNKRPVRDRLFLGALKAAYQDYIEKGRHPVVALFVTVDPREVDVNAHPTKAEVRFRQEQILRSFLIGAIRQTLKTHGQMAAMALTEDTLMKFQATQQAVNAPLLDYAAHHARSLNALSQTPSTPLSSYQLTALPFKASIERPFQKHPNGGPHLFVVEKDTPPQSDNSITQDAGFMGYAKAQIGKSYILSETDSGFYLVDQHAAHERIKYERLKQNYLTQNVSKQFLVIPFMKNLTIREKELFETNQTLLNKFGFDYDIFGQDLVVRAVPTLLAKHDPELLLDDLIDDLNANASSLTCEEHLLSFLSTHACHTSIRAGDTLQISEMNALLRSIETTQNSATCNHGRPTYIKLTFDDIEKLFSRK